VYSRVTQLEIDITKIAVAEAMELLRREVLPSLRRQEGYEGVCVLTAPGGRGVLLSLWASPEAAAAAGETGLLPGMLAPFVTPVRSPGEPEGYEVAFADVPALVIG